MSSAMIATLERVAGDLEYAAQCRDRIADIAERENGSVERYGLADGYRADAARLRSLATILESAQWGPDGSLDPVTCGRIRELLDEEGG